MEIQLGPGRRCKGKKELAGPHQLMESSLKEQLLYLGVLCNLLACAHVPKHSVNITQTG